MELDLKETRIINLYDDDQDLLVLTNAPKEIIREALKYKNQMLENDVPTFRSDFEEMQEYIWDKGYEFDQIGYVSDIEGYNW